MKPPPSLDSLTGPSRDTHAARRIPGWVFPVAILSGFALLFLALFRDRLVPATRVEVASALALTEAGDDKTSGSLLFQASGWIEPDPLPTKATSLVDGVIEAVHVLEGQSVKRGEILATLVEDDARLALAAAEQRHKILISTRESHLGTILSVKRKLEGVQAQEIAAAALRDEAADRSARLRGLANGAISQIEITSAQLRAESEEANLRAATAATAEAKAEIARLELETQVREDDIRAAEIEVEQARLAFSRTRIASPIDGRVLRLLSAPGQKKMLSDNDPDSSTVAILYDPAKLQVRVDVPLADAAGLQIGQKARVRCSLLPDRIFEGTVTRITGEADLQRNTLQAKVGIAAPSDQLRPEMLCRVEFIGTAAATTSLAVWLPEAAVKDRGVWVCDPETKRVTRRSIEPSGEIREGFLRVTQGVLPGEWVVVSPASLRDGQRVNPNLIEP